MPVSTAEAAPRRHLYAVDVMRVLTVALVVGVHTVSHADLKDTVAAGALTVVLHTSREVFFVLTTLVLMHGYGRREVRWTGFWKRRYLCVVVPYVAWSVIYMVADGHWRDPLGSALATFGSDLLTGAAKYQMYFLLVSMQIYLCFPMIRWIIRATRGHHRLLLAGCAAFQLAFSLAVHVQWSPGGVITAWVHGPDAVLPSYLLYIAAGGVAAWHLEALIAWTRTHRLHVLGGTALTIAAAVGVYLLQRLALGETTLEASGVFQPVVVAESLAIAWTFLAAGLAWTDRGRPGLRLVRTLSDASFGVYLAHPLVLMLLTSLLAPAPLPVVLAMVPAVYLLGAVPALLLRGTPLSLIASGRRRRRRSPVGHARAAADAVAA
jgi:peptidoglycan/LPS O-acetylase OafA/YrhL